MREVVLVPTFQRPEFLYCCLEAIRVAEPLISLHVFADRGTNEIAICEEFGAASHSAPVHRYHGNSYNVLESLKWAYQQMYEIIYIIEDDSIIDPSFFSWCRNALEHPPFNEPPFAACGWRASPDLKPTDGPDMLLGWYLSVAAALPRRSVYSIVQHARPEYYADMQNYLDRAYPNSHRRKSMHYEQDGLTLRVSEAESKRCVWPRRPRAVHIGWRGYHMPEGKDLEGTFEDRVALVRLAIKNPSVLAGLMAGARAPELSRCEVCQTLLLTDNKNARTVCVACFHAAHPGVPVTSSSHYYLPLGLHS